METGGDENVGQVEPGRSLWHSDGASDGKWAVGDDFDGNVTLINRKTGQRTLVTAGHYMRPDHTHPNFSRDGKRLLIQSGMISKGTKLDLMTVAVPTP